MFKPVEDDEEPSDAEECIEKERSEDSSDGEDDKGEANDEFAEGR